jgi:hypothetical protein
MISGGSFFGWFSSLSSYCMPRIFLNSYKTHNSPFFLPLFEKNAIALAVPATTISYTLMKSMNPLIVLQIRMNAHFQKKYRQLYQILAARISGENATHLNSASQTSVSVRNFSELLF